MTIDTRVPSHFERIGGATAVRLAVEKLYGRILNDGDLAHHFAGTDLVRLKRHQGALLTYLLGGPGTYQGRSLAEAHKDLRVTGDDFDRVAGHLVATLHELSVPLDIVDSLVSTVAGVRPQIVTEPQRSRGKGLLGYLGFRRTEG